MPCTSTVPKCFGPDQKFSAVPKKICAGAKTKFTEWKSSFALAHIGWEWHNMKINIWCGTKNLDQPKTFWDL